MAQTFEERVEEVLGALHGMAWPLLEEPEKKRIVAKVVRGIDRYSDSQRGWARALGVSESTLRARIDHFRRSEPMDGAQAQIHNTTGRALRGARQVLRDPELREELLSEPGVRRSVEESLYAQPEVDGSRNVIRKTIDSTHDADRILGPLGHIHSVLWREARKIATVQQPRKVERDELLLAADELRMYADTFESFGKSSLDSADFAEWIAERQEER